MPELRLRRLWLGAGLFMSLLFAAGFLVPIQGTPGGLLSDKAIHVIAFGLMGFWFGSIVVRRDLLWLLLVLVAFGGFIELAQGVMGLGRQAELFDLLADGIGVMLGLALGLTPLGRWPRWMEALVGRTAA